MLSFPSFIYLYNGGKTESLNLEEISEYLKSLFKSCKIVVKPDILQDFLSKFSSEEKLQAVNNLATEMAKIKIRKINERNTVFEPLHGEIEYEKKKLLDPQNKSFGILYDGFKLMTILSNLINDEKRTSDYCHIVFTNQLFSTWDENDRRYHLRVSVYGFPSIISTTGIVEAPAKPREFYLKKQIGINVENLKTEFSGRFIDYDDPHMTEVMKGYVMQAIFYHVTGYPFCEDKNCRLYNAHWQEEIIQAQLNTDYEFCQKHKEIIKQFGK